MYVDKHYHYNELVDLIDAKYRSFTPQVIELLNGVTDKFGPERYHYDRFPMVLTYDQNEVTLKAVTFHIELFGYEDLTKIFKSIGVYETLWLVRSAFALFSHNFMGYAIDGYNPLSIVEIDPKEKLNVSSIYLLCFLVAAYYSTTSDNYKNIFDMWVGYYKPPQELVASLWADINSFVIHNAESMVENTIH